jgi:hypothetical protein
VEKTKHTHTLSLSLSFLESVLLQLVKVYIEEEIATIKKHRRSKFTQHILSLSLPLNSILCLLSQGFVSIIVANNLRKCNRARHDGIRRDRQTDRKKKRLDDSQEMPSSVMSAILQVHDITFTVTSSMIRTCKESKGKQHHKRLVAVIIGLLVSVIHDLHHHHHQHIIFFIRHGKGSSGGGGIIIAAAITIPIPISSATAAAVA